MLLRRGDLPPAPGLAGFGLGGPGSGERGGQDVCPRPPSWGRLTRLSSACRPCPKRPTAHCTLKGPSVPAPNSWESLRAGGGGHTAHPRSFWRTLSCSCATLSGPRCLAPLGPSYTSLLMAALRMLICRERAGAPGGPGAAGSLPLLLSPARREPPPYPHPCLQQIPDTSHFHSQCRDVRNGKKEAKITKKGPN